MSRIHPDHNRFEDSSTTTGLPENVKDHDHGSDDRVLTVWKRSSMSFQGTDGFTVFDSTGRLVFRVDNYSRKDRGGFSGGGGGGGLVLMDGSGKALLTLKPQTQILSMQNQWNGYRGEAGYNRRTSPKSRELMFTMRRRSSLIHTAAAAAARECEAEVFIGGGGGAKSHRSTPDFRVEGSFRRRNCKIIKCSGGGGCVVVAKIERKRVKNSTIVLSDDVFSLVVKPGFDPQLIMAFVIILDRICPIKSFSPLLCS